MYIYICNHEKNVPSRLSPKWLCDKYTIYIINILYIAYSVCNIVVFI